MMDVPTLYPHDRVLLMVPVSFEAAWEQFEEHLKAQFPGVAFHPLCASESEFRVVFVWRRPAAEQKPEMVRSAEEKVKIFGQQDKMPVMAQWSVPAGQLRA